MKVKIEDIVVNERIRKEFGDVSDLARDIDENGLINPITITKDNVLVAGERRLEACKLLGFDEVEVHILEIGDETHFLMAEISENEQRKEFTFSEKMRWAERLKRLHKRRDYGSCEPISRTDDLIAKEIKIGSGVTYRRGKYVFEHADDETIRQLDEGTLAINTAYRQLKAQAEAQERCIKQLEADEAAASVQIDQLEQQLSAAKEENTRLKAGRCTEVEADLTKKLREVQYEIDQQRFAAERNEREYREERRKREAAEQALLQAQHDAASNTERTFTIPTRLCNVCEMIDSMLVPFTSMEPPEHEVWHDDERNQCLMSLNAVIKTLADLQNTVRSYKAS